MKEKCDDGGCVGDGGAHFVLAYSSYFETPCSLTTTVFKGHIVD